MLKTIMVLPDGTEVSSGIGHQVAIKSCKITECVNSGEELVVGSCGSTCVELTVIAPGGWKNHGTGSRFTLYREDSSGDRRKVGIFTAEKPVHKSANTCTIVGYDNVSLLEKELGGWLSGQWPEDRTAPLCTLQEFARRVCGACGVELDESEPLPNGGLQVMYFQKDSVTGRQLLSWVGECAGRFCHASPDGLIRFDTYRERDMVLSPDGGNWYFSLKHDGIEVAQVDGLCYYGGEGTTDSGRSVKYWGLDGASEQATENPYTVSPDDPLWVYRYRAEDLNELQPVGKQNRTLLEAIRSIGAYHPCKIAVPAELDVAAGDIVTVVSPNGAILRVPVMTRTVTGQRAMLESTGTASRSSAASVNQRSSNQTPQQAVAMMTGQDILDKLGAMFNADGYLVKKG